ncbi:uncharacterized protein LOC113352705 [Papaver somniferum]|uniref:uncharacterized protein LOC113352705 n=1 Tax=Papaver somniferum TaxID=3469 RepID=UPI000E6FEEEA|nr:uncharacterized protein LOC113352705 [Papaver somniferum]
MADPVQNSTNSDGNLLIAPPETPEFVRAKLVLPSLSIMELQRLRDDTHYEIDQRKDEEKAEKQAKTPRYESATESDSKALNGGEYEVEEVNTSDLDSDAAEDKRRMKSYHDGKTRSRFEYELSNPKIFARTMSEGEPVGVRISRRMADLDAETTEEEREEGDEDSDDESSSIGTSPASSDSDSENYGEEGLDTDEEDWW